MPIRRELNHDFFKKWSPEMAYVLGYFAADGSMVRNQRGAHFIEFTTVDPTLLSQVRKAVQSNHLISTRTRNDTKWKMQYRLQIGSKRWFESLSELGFTPAKSKKLCLPPTPKKYFGHFVRGYFDGDGSVHFNRYWSKWHKKRVWVFTSRFTSGCRLFLVNLHRKLCSHGLLGGYITRKTKGFELVFSRHDSLALHRLMYHTAPISPLYLPRKRHKLERAIRILKLRMRE